MGNGSQCTNVSQWFFAGPVSDLFRPYFLFSLLKRRFVTDSHDRLRADVCKEVMTLPNFEVNSSEKHRKMHVGVNKGVHRGQVAKNILEVLNIIL